MDKRGFDKFDELSKFPNAVNLIESLKMWEKVAIILSFDTKQMNPIFAVKSSLRKNPIGILYRIISMEKAQKIYTDKSSELCF